MGQKKITREWMAAYQEGRMYIAPCTDGTDIYVIVYPVINGDTILHPEIAQIEKETYIHGFTEYMHGEFGKGFWFTKEAAEAEFNKKCRVCGCTWDHVCEGGCYWIEKDLCSRCAQISIDDSRR